MIDRTELYLKLYGDKHLTVAAVLQVLQFGFKEAAICGKQT